MGRSRIMRVHRVGSVSYVGGFTSQIIVKIGIKYNDFVNAVVERLGIEPSDKILQLTVQFDRSQLINLRVQEDVSTLFQFNDNFAHVYVSILVKEPNPIPPSGAAKEDELNVVSNSDSDSDSQSDMLPDSGPPLINCYHDPDFSDFDKQKAENCFATNQIWALKDLLDGMPTFCARIRKVSNPKFFIKISWLEPHPEDQREVDYVKTNLPVVSGKFIHEDSEYISDQLMFSHQVSCKNGAGDVYIVYPRKGKTWALLKDWDSNWSANPDNHRKYKYAVVEILSDYVGDSGVQVAYFDKVSGFVSIFQWTRLAEVGTFWLKPKDIYKFSHQIPSLKMTGIEGESVHKGSFELDPASLLLNSDDISYLENFKKGCRIANSEPAVNILSVTKTKNKSRINVNAMKDAKVWNFLVNRQNMLME